MATDKKISELTATTTLAESDVLPVVNDSTTKKITLANLRSQISSTWLTDLLPATDDTYDIGSALKRWQDLFLSGTATVTGAVVSKTDTLVKPFITVGTSGAVDYLCDGTADDVQIQQALTAVGTAGGGIVLIKKGTYDITAILTIPSNITLQGEGWVTILKASVSLYSILRNSDTTNGNNNIIIRDLMLDGNYLAGTASASPNGYDGIIYFRTNAHACTGCKVINCKVIKSNTGGGISFSDILFNQDQVTDTSSAWNGCGIYNCWVEDVGVGSGGAVGNTKGIRTVGASNIEIANNYVKDVQDQAIHTANGKYINIHHNLLTNADITTSYGGGIWLSYETSDSNISDNIIGTSNAFYGFAIYSQFGYAINNVIANNIIYKSYGGIYVVGSKTQVEGNIIYGSKNATGCITVGFQSTVTTSGQYIDIIDNVIYNPDYIAIYNNASNVNITGNQIYSAGGSDVTNSPAILSTCTTRAISNLNISNNTIIDTESRFAIWFYKGVSNLDHTNSIIANNNIVNSTVVLIRIQATAGKLIKIVGNTLTTSTATSPVLYIDGCTKVIVSDNNISTVLSGIRIDGSDWIVDGNYLETTTDNNLIYEVAGADYNIITNNNVRNKLAGTAATIVVLGANTEIGHNLGY